MSRRSAPAPLVAKLGSALLVLAALAWQAIGGIVPGTVPVSGSAADSASSSANASIPEGWQSWDEQAAPNYVLEEGPAQVRADVEAGQISYSALDELGRPGLVAASLTHETRVQAKERGRQDIDVNPAGWPETNPKVGIETPSGDTYKGRFWNRSHLLADSLGGDPTRENLVTGTRMQNAGGQMARSWLDDHETGTLYYSTLPLYVGDEPIPRAVVVDMRSSDGQIDCELLVFNAAKGYEVDYETGSVTRS